MGNGFLIGTSALFGASRFGSAVYVFGGIIGLSVITTIALPLLGKGNVPSIL
jgi:hypothetical protein